MPLYLQSYDDESGSAPLSIRSQAFSLSSYYQSMYDVLNKIVGYGRVFECRHKLDGMTYGVKKIPFNEDNEDQVIHLGLRKVMNYLVQMITHMAQILQIHRPRHSMWQWSFAMRLHNNNNTVINEQRCHPTITKETPSSDKETT
ncbi:uncharacterized protein LOC142522260 [Primulina tabacum]|uniref:uncharacterized protein LOC142522260 n=1 Tax=Primulina tabacum TaxID=48773 RepID=UPI003F594706